MKFSALVAILADELEEKAIKVAKEAGAEGVTIMSARGIGAIEKKIFFGLTHEGSQSVLIFILERKLSVAVLKSISKELELGKHSKGVVFTLPLEHIAGIDPVQIQRFEQRIKDEL
ncbi:MAG: transcriptional regulator [Helicobacteraceae bacterium]|jgi:nitrogen regulatory protein PII|nr:transcriptional regulator [Helicobacteraceae bacterium]